KYVTGRRTPRGNVDAYAWRAAPQYLRSKHRHLVRRKGRALQKIWRARHLRISFRLGRAGLIYSRQLCIGLIISTLNMKRILVPIDFSDVTPRVIGVAQQLAKALDA